MKELEMKAKLTIELAEAKKTHGTQEVPRLSAGMCEFVRSKKQNKKKTNANLKSYSNIVSDESAKPESREILGE